METTNTSGLDYSKISVTDMCYFLNDKAVLTNNNYIKKFNPLLISKVEMYEYIKFKTDNFDKIKFQLVFDEIASYCFEYMDFYRLEKVDGKFINKYVTDYEIDYNFTDKEPYEYICRILELNKGLIVNCKQIIEFIKIAEDLYKTICETPVQIAQKSQDIKQYQFTNDLTDTQRGKLYDLLVLHKFIPESDKAGFIWAFGGKNEKYTSFKTEWLKAKNLAVYLIEQLCYDITATTHFWAIGTRIFGIENMAQMKENYTDVNKTGKPRGYKIIDNIINEIKA